MNENAMHRVNPYIISCGTLKKCPAPGTSYGVRTVKWYELELITEGNGYIITEGKNIPAVGGTIFYRAPGIKVEGISPYYCYIIIFDMCYDHKLADEYNNSSNLHASHTHVGLMKKRGQKQYNKIFGFPHSFVIKNYYYYSKIFAGIYRDNFDNTKHSIINNKAALLNLMSLLSDNLTENKLSSASRSIRNNYNKIMKARKYMDTFSNRKLTLNQAAEIAGLSPNFFCRIFKEITRKSPVSYLNSVRIKKACLLLTESEMSISKISYECGFENDTYFYTIFKKFTGQTPTQYKNSRLIYF